MPNKPSSTEHKPDGDAPDRDTDTGSYAQPQGATGERETPNRPNQKLPHERDESSGSTGDRLDEDLPPSERQISQAQKDIAAGLVDTDRRGIPDDVPGAKR